MNMGRPKREIPKQQVTLTLDKPMVECIDRMRETIPRSTYINQKLKELFEDEPGAQAPSGAS